MKQHLRYDQTSCRLQLEGLPDVSAGQSSQAIGIITGWTLQWIGHPRLEGRRDHLLALLQAVLPYARHLISGVPRSFGDGEQPVSIGPHPQGGHHLFLRSSQEGVEPLALRLDDAELADLVRVLDQLRMDPRLQLELPLADPEPLPARELIERIPLRQRLAAPVAGMAALLLAGAVAVTIPPPAPVPTAEPSPGRTTGEPAEGRGSTSP